MYLRLNTYLLLKDDTDNKYNGGIIEMFVVNVAILCWFNRINGDEMLLVRRC